MYVSVDPALRAEQQDGTACAAANILIATIGVNSAGAFVHTSNLIFYLALATNCLDSGALFGPYNL